MQHLRHAVSHMHSAALVRTYILIIGFLYLADATLAYTFPILLEGALQSPARVGAIMAISSAVGILCDVLFPRLLAGWSWHRIIFVGTCVAALFSLSVHTSIAFLPVVFGIIAVALWGMYYELIGFSQDRFVVQSVERNRYFKTWATLGIASLFAIVAAPLVGNTLLQGGLATHTLAILAIQSIAIFLALRAWRHARRHHPHHPRYRGHITRTASLFATLYYWRHLFVPLLPLILCMFLFRCIEAAYWMFGAIYAADMGGIFADRAWLLLLLYTAPFIAAYGAMQLFPHHFHKRRLAFAAIGIGGVATVLAHHFFQQPSLMLPLLIVGNFAFALVPTSIAAVSSGIQEFLPERFRMYVTGLMAMSGSIAYILTPLIGGWIAESYSFLALFMGLGALSAAGSIILFLFAPKHVRIATAALR